MAKRGRKPKAINEESYDANGPIQDNFLEKEDEGLLQFMDRRDAERYIQPYHRSHAASGDGDEDSFAFWYGKN
jgi:hypothetical protein